MGKVARAWAWTHQHELPNAEGRMLLRLAEYADDDGACFASREKLAEWLGGDRSVFTKRRQALERKGLLRYEEGHNGYASRYYLNLSRLPASLTPEMMEQLRVVGLPNGDLSSPLGDGELRENDDLTSPITVTSRHELVTSDHPNRKNRRDNRTGNGRNSNGSHDLEAPDREHQPPSPIPPDYPLNERARELTDRMNREKPWGKPPSDTNYHLAVGRMEHELERAFERWRGAEVHLVEDWAFATRGKGISPNDPGPGTGLYLALEASMKRQGSTEGA